MTKSDGMSVAIISSLHGGIGSFTLNLSKSLENYVEDIDIYVKSDPNRSLPVDLKDTSKIDIYRMGSSEETFVAKMIWKISNLSEYDIIHMIDVSVFPHVYISSKLGDPTVIFTCHGPPDPTEFRTFSKLNIYSYIDIIAQKSIFSYADEIVTMTHDVKQRIESAYGITPKVIHHGVDRSDFYPNKNIDTKQLDYVNIDDSTDICLFVGYLWEHKDILTLIESIPQISEDIEFIIIGRGPQYQPMKEKISELGISNRVHIVEDYVEDISVYYAAADAFVMPATREEFGLVYLEALASGLPVIAVNDHVVPEVVNDAGLLFPPGNCSKLAENINKIFENPGLYNELQMKAQDRAEQFSWDTAAEKYYSLYTESII